ncbi:GtrA family protein [candidate division WS5 bacterium]|uniref:GtrA family protein n=1 Tax=candidate division WS5 bacterium TaxID=2093353 RepID=A0A419DGR0_9BACT|nr:MAG: GtrA family protein [candidate division WS5 bacterium]
MKKTKLLYCSQNLLEKIFKYIFIGIISLIIDAGFLYIFTEFLKINYLISAGISFLIALLFNFQMNREWTFSETRGKYTKQFISYIVLVIFNLFFTILFMYVSTDILNIYYLYSKIIIITLIALWNFILYRKVIFK